MKALKRGRTPGIMIGNFLLGSIILFCLVSPAAAKPWYIGPSGSDNNTGLTENSPLLGIEANQSKFAPGDTIWILDGTLSREWQHIITKSGNSGAWIVYKAKNRLKSIIQSTNTSAYQDGFRVNADYIVIDGFKITNKSQGHGVNLQNSHHAKIINCEIYNCGGSGISGAYNDYATIENNVVHHCAFTNPYQCSGISLWLPVSPVGDNTPGTRFIIRNNVIYGCENRVPSGSVFTDGNGIILDNFTNLWSSAYPNDYPTTSLRGQQLPDYIYGALIEGNVCYDNGGRGINVLNSDNVTMRFNTLYKNVRAGNLDGTWYGDLHIQSSANCSAIGNIVYGGAFNNNGNTTKAIAFGVGTTRSGVDYGVSWDYNIVYGAAVSVQNDKNGGHNQTNVDPKFVKPSVNPDSANFKLQSSSPGIDAIATAQGPATDIAGTTRPRNNKWDIGAYEYISPSTYVMGQPMVAQQTSPRMYAGSGSMTLFDLRGRIIWTRSTNPSTARNQILFEKIKTGAYILKVQQGDEIAVRKMHSVK